MTDRHLQRTVSARLSDEQRAELARRAAAAGLGVSAYIVQKLDLPPDPRPARRGRPKKQRPASGQDGDGFSSAPAPAAPGLSPAAVSVLQGLLRQAQQDGNNLNQLTRTAHLGQLSDGATVGPALLADHAARTREILRALGRPLPAKRRR